MDDPGEGPSNAQPGGAGITHYHYERMQISPGTSTKQSTTTNDIETCMNPNLPQIRRSVGDARFTESQHLRNSSLHALPSKNQHLPSTIGQSGKAYFCHMLSGSPATFGGTTGISFVDQKLQRRGPWTCFGNIEQTTSYAEACGESNTYATQTQTQLRQRDNNRGGSAGGEYLHLGRGHF